LFIKNEILYKMDICLFVCFERTYNILMKFSVLIFQDNHKNNVEIFYKIYYM
jgi:hypothetical protein